RPQGAKERNLARLKRHQKIIPAVQHQHWHPHAGRIVPGIDLARPWPWEASRQEHSGLETGLQRQKPRAVEGPEADAIERKLADVDVLSRFEVVERAPQILEILKCVIPELIRRLPRRRGTPFQRADVRRNHHRPTRPNDELIRIGKGINRWENKNLPRAKQGHDLVWARDPSREKQMNEQPRLVIVRRSKADGLSAPVFR